MKLLMYNKITILLFFISSVVNAFLKTLRRLLLKQTII